MAAFIRIVFLCGVSIALGACGGSGGGDSSSGSSNSGGPPANSPTPALAYAAIKTLRFSWTNVAGATHYKLLENPDGASGYTQVGSDMASGVQTMDHVVPLYKRVNARYILQTCNNDGCTDSAPVNVSGNLKQAVGYFKASNTQSGDAFGYAVSLSSDGNTLAVGAITEDSNATGIDGDENNDSAMDSGAVYVFSRDSADGAWSQQAYIKASKAEGFEFFGWSAALSADGNTLAVGAHFENSNATGVNGDQDNNSASGAGAVYVFTRENNLWSQQAYIKASNTGSSDLFGSAMSLSGDGDTLAVGAPFEDSNATATDGNQADNSAASAGAVYLFIRENNLWSQQAYIKASNTDADDQFGSAISLDSDGNTLAVGAPREDSNSTVIDGDEDDNSASNTGAVYLFTRDNNAWSQQAYIKAGNAGTGFFGHSLSHSSDGNLLAVGALLEDSNGGAVYLFARDSVSGGWNQQAYIKASNADSADLFGYALSLSADGNTLAVGAVEEDSNATGINDDETDNSASIAGAVYLFTRDNSVWSQKAYIKASNTDAGDVFGHTLSLDSAGNTLAIGTYAEASSTTGIDGDQSDNSATEAGAVYLY